MNRHKHILYRVYLKQLTFEQCVCFSSLTPIKLFAFILILNCLFFFFLLALHSPVACLTKGHNIISNITTNPG